jgi:hypothetical protein
MAKETDVNFVYIPRQRYIVEIKDKNWKRPVFTRRICSINEAVRERNDLSALTGITARIHDTKTGVVIEGDFLTSG